MPLSLCQWHTLPTAPQDFSKGKTTVASRPSRENHMTAQTRVIAAISVIALVGLGNVVAQSDFSQALSPAGHARGPRHRPHPPVVVIPKSTADFGDPLPGLTPPSLPTSPKVSKTFRRRTTPAAAWDPSSTTCPASHVIPSLPLAEQAPSWRRGSVVPATASSIRWQHWVDRCFNSPRSIRWYRRWCHRMQTSSSCA